MDHLGEWRALWKKAGEIAARCCPNDEFPPTSGPQREAFEFLRTALVYHRNCLDALDPIRMHEKLRSHQRLWTNNALLRLHDPLFRGLTDPDAYKATAGPFLASASVRVAVGVLAAIRINRATFPYTYTKLKSGELEVEWDRNGAETAFAPVKNLGHCGDRALGSTSSDILAHAAVIILVHRDNFGHGEVGVGKAYRYGREGVLDEIYWCRLLEAQRVLIRWCLDEFK